MYRLVLRRRFCRLALVTVPGFLLSGCAMFGSQPSALGGGYRSIKDDLAAAPAAKSEFKAIPPIRKRSRVAARPGRASVLPACETGSECMVLLKALIDNRDRSWIGQRQSPADHATGTRLFAYRALRRDLNCRELTLALGEIEAAAAVFRSPVPGIDAEKADRVLALNAAVDAELRTERARRCKG